MKTATRAVLITVGVLAIGAVAAPAVIARVSPATTIQYLTETVTRSDVTRTVAATGRMVDARTYAIVPGADPVLTERAGRRIGTAAAARGYTTTDLRVVVGETVEKGDVLAVVEDSEGDKTRVRAPFDGVVREVLTTEDASAGQVLTLGVGGRRAALEVSEYDVARVTRGQQASVELNGTGQRISATVVSVAPTATSTSGVQTYDTLLRGTRIPTAARIGMTVTGTVTVRRERDVLTVPTTAVSTVDGGHTVRVLTDAGQPETRVIETGLVGDRTTQVRRGLQEGERVITGTDGAIAEEQDNGFLPPAPGGVAPGAGGTR
jgi:macrolide-specific efflux system membrane fusion protein